MSFEKQARFGRAIADESDTESVAMKRQRYDNSEDDEPPPKKMPFTSPLTSKLAGLNGLSSSRRDRTQSTHEKPAELFRKDLISAMKLADSDPLQQGDYLLISDPWRQEWERGVQVPVNPDSIPEPSLSVKIENENLHGPYQFKLPKKFLHATQDNGYKQGIHELHETQKLAEQVCRYDLDDLDVSWLTMFNEERECMREQPVAEWVMEKVVEELECQCYNNMQNMIKTVEGLGIEYDENVVCDVCRSPDSEDNNEMVFCDSCDICVHQACYGIQNIPEGSWLCRTCALGIKPTCMLCPRTGGAMKSTKSGSKWAHVSCALWIPEVSIGCPEKMEPITKISQIPSSRWSLICSLCRERTGACIQCSVKTCKTAFHVTCAFHNHLDMKTILEEDNDDVQLKAYCTKHSKKKEGDCSPRKGDGPLSPRKESEMTEEEKTELRSHRLQKLAEEFYICVKPEEVAKTLKMDGDTIDFIFSYWVLKRKSNFNKPLLTPKTEEADLLSKQREDSLIARMKMFIHLRQDLERVRNLCYMVTRREKQRRAVYKMKEDIFHTQVELLEEDKYNRPGTRDFSAIVSAHKLSAEDSVYDQYDEILHAADKAEEQAVQEDEAADMVDRIPRLKFKDEQDIREAELELDDTTLVVKDVLPDESLSDLGDISEESEKSEKGSLSGRERPARDSDGSNGHILPVPTRSSRRMTSDTVGKGLGSPVIANKLDSDVDKSDSDSTLSSQTEPRPSRNLRVKDQNRLSPKATDPAQDPKSKNKLNGQHIPVELVMERKLRDRIGGGSPKPRPPAINGVLCSRDKLIVSDAIKERVQSRLLRGRRSHLLNGLQDQTQKKLESFFHGSNQSVDRDQRENRAEIAAVNVFTHVHLSPRQRINKAIRGARRSYSSANHSPRLESSAETYSPAKSSSWPTITSGRRTPDTRGSRHRLESESESSDKLSIERGNLSSRDTTPEKRGRGRPRKSLPFGRKKLQTHLKKSNRRTLDSDMSEEDVKSVTVEDSDSEYAPSEASEGYTRRLTRRRLADNLDENSRDSTNSSISRNSSRSSRSKSAPEWSKVISTCQS